VGISFDFSFLESPSILSAFYMKEDNQIQKQLNELSEHDRELIVEGHAKKHL